MCHPHFSSPCPSLPMCICGNVYKCLNLCPCWKTWFAVYSPPLKEIRPVFSDTSQRTDADSIRFLNTDLNNKSWLDWVWIGLTHLNAICLTHSWPVCSVEPLNLNQSFTAIKWNNGGVERALKRARSQASAITQHNRPEQSIAEQTGPLMLFPFCVSAVLHHESHVALHEMASSKPNAQTPFQAFVLSCQLDFTC